MQEILSIFSNDQVHLPYVACRTFRNTCNTLLYRVSKKGPFSTFRRVKRMLFIHKLSFQYDNLLLKQEKSVMRENSQNFCKSAWSVASPWGGGGLKLSQMAFLEYSYQTQSKDI